MPIPRAWKNRVIAWDSDVEQKAKEESKEELEENAEENVKVEEMISVESAEETRE